MYNIFKIFLYLAYVKTNVLMDLLEKLIKIQTTQNFSLIPFQSEFNWYILFISPTCLSKFFVVSQSKKNVWHMPKEKIMI